MSGAWRRWLLRLCNSLRPERQERELSQELSAHLGLLEDEFRRQGLGPEESRRAAALALGGLDQAKEMHREARSLPWIEDARRDLRHALRQLRRNPVFAATGVASLAVAIGVNTAVFTLVDALLLRPPVGVAAPERLVEIGMARGDGGFNPASYPTYLDLRSRATTLAGLYAHPMFPQAMGLGEASGTGASERVFAQAVTTSYFAVLGAVPAAGRLLGDSDGGDPGGDDVVVLSHRLWERLFDKRAGAVGRILRLDGRPFTVLGVAPAGFQGTGVIAADLWLPLAAVTGRDHRSSVLANRGAGWLVIGGRLRSGINAAQAAAEVDAIGHALDREYPDRDRARGLRLLPSARVAGNGGAVGAFLGLLTAVAATVLAVACANLAGVLLARGAARRTEIAVRQALGASRRRLIGQLLTETALLFLLGAGAGLLLACVATPLLVRRLPELPFPVHVSLALDGRAIAFTIAVALIAALTFGLAPALRASDIDVTAALKDERGGRARRPALRSAFLVLQVALSVLLVALGGVFVRALQRAGSADPGFDARDVQLVSLDVSMGGYTEATGPGLWRDLAERIRGRPGVKAVTVARVVPGGFEGIGLGGVVVRDPTAPDGQRSFRPSWNIVEPGYFATLGIPLVDGRDFAPGDRPGAPAVAIVGEGVARRLWPGRSAVGRLMTLEAGRSPTALLVVGVAADVRSSSLVDGLAASFVYLPLQQHYTADMTAAMTIAIRTAMPGLVANEVRSVVDAVDPRLPVVRSQPLEEAVALGVVPQSIAASSAGTLGLVGLLLAGTGLYGVTAYTVARRRREIGVRMALGASRRDILRMVVGEGLWAAGLGSAIGVALAVAATSALGGFLFDLPTLDPLPFAGAVALLALVALVACLVPARSATRVDPLTALRYE